MTGNGIGWRTFAIIGLTVTIASACANVAWFRFGPTPPALVGVWIDASKSTPTDTVAWVLAANGEDRTLTVHVAAVAAGSAPQTMRRETSYGVWYLAGTLGDTTSQAICVKRRPRDGPSCAPFRLDTLPAMAGEPARRRLRVLGFRGAHHTRDRLLLERR